MDSNLSNTLKRCLSAPVIHNLSGNLTQPARKPTACSLARMTSSAATTTPSNSSSREVSPAPIMNIFAPRARRYSASFATIGAANMNSAPCLTPRVSQLRQEECVDINTREVSHEREVHSAMQISQSWEDLTIVAESWSCKSDDLSNPLQVTLPAGSTSCSSPSPTSRAGMRLPYGLSPSPTRRTFATRRSMSPIAMRPSQLGPVKRKFELDDNNTATYSPPPLKKIFTESRGSSPVCQSPSSMCPSPDSGLYEGRITPKLFVPKFYSNYANSSSSICSSPMVPSPQMDVGIDLQSNNSSSPANTISSSSNEPTCIVNFHVDSLPQSNADIKSFNDDTLMDNEKISETDKNSLDINHVQEDNINDLKNTVLTDKAQETEYEVKPNTFTNIIAGNDSIIINTSNEEVDTIQNRNFTPSESECKI